MTIVDIIGWLLIEGGSLIVVLALAAQSREINITE